jgi:N-acetylglucosaminyl-diphospho-decaprenol L-rhamnosyltransferase
VPDLSVVIVNWNTADYLRRCLDSISSGLGFGAPHNAGWQPQIEVIVVDNASKDGSAEMVRREFPWVRLVANPTNAGYAAGNNQGIKLSSGRYLLLLNPDTIVPDGALGRLVEYMDEHPEAGIVGVRLLNPDGTVQPSCRSFPEPAYLLYETLGLARLFRKSRRFAAYRMGWFDHNSEMEVDQPMGSALAVRREVFEDIGLFDEQFPLFFNEVDLCYRAKLKGWKVVFTPTVEIVHYGGRGTSQVRLKALWESHCSLVRFYRKHYRRRIPLAVYLLVVLSIYLGALFRIGWAAATMRKASGCRGGKRSGLERDCA